jgi:hypothetical protein
MKYFVTAFLQTFKKCFKMNGCTPWMPKCHDFVIPSWFKALHTKRTNKNHETLEVGTQISISMKIYLEKGLKFCSFVLFYNLKSYWFIIPLWQMQASCMALGCDHNQMSQQWQRTQGLWSFSLSRRKNFWDDIFCNMLLKMHIIFSIHHIFCINFSWITKNIFKSVQVLPNFVFCFEKLS